MNILLEKSVVQIAEQVSRFERTRQWQNYSEDELWREFIACNLGSRVKFELTKATISYLDSRGILKYCRTEFNNTDLERVISDSLRQPLTVEIAGRCIRRKYPFHNLKARHITRTAVSIYGSGTSLVKILKMGRDPLETRNLLVSKSVGIGPKQASLFLRNIGYCTDLAVLDVHVLRYMSFVGLLPSIIKTVQNIRQYEMLENLLRAYSYKLSLSMGTLDISIWIVMRVAYKGGVA